MSRRGSGARRPPALKRFSQNFLVDRRVAGRIVDAARIDDAQVVEIGPGRGMLTELLAERAALLRAVEVDRALSWTLAERFQDAPTVEVVHGDVLEVGLGALVGSAGEWSLVSNLPYRITTPVLMAAIAARARVRNATLMMQREVALRLAAEPATREWGALGVQVQRWAKVTRCFDVPPGAFRPRPKVTSTVVHLELRAEPAVTVVDDAVFDRLVRAVFGQRRKTLRNALTAGGFAAERIAAIPDVLGVELRERGETLDLEELGRLADHLAGG